MQALITGVILTLRESCRVPERDEWRPRPKRVGFAHSTRVRPFSLYPPLGLSAEPEPLTLQIVKIGVPKTPLDLAPAAVRSLRTILEIADHVSPGHLRHEVATVVKGLFDLLAWSDGKLDAQEKSLLDRLCTEVPEIGEICSTVDEYDPADPTLSVVPPLLTAVVDHDRHSGERLAPVLVSALEKIGIATIAASGNLLDIEKSELYTYVNNMRSLSRMLTTAGR